ncbi:hypothetical protein Ddye_026147 [Dipteronia dyeriana]|uniref:Uncharacterized protein n=1 Tax=Dipteronia dyeriana TaxID=168575 RepID=A0AAD9TM85_9ROSI|nr:hypothetical protein Ddye_026147 [Dipteronia dyeriana]
MPHEAVDNRLEARFRLSKPWIGILSFQDVGLMSLIMSFRLSACSFRYSCQFYLIYKFVMCCSSVHVLSKQQKIKVPDLLSQEKSSVFLVLLEWEKLALVVHSTCFKVEVTSAVILALVENYCREAGVRNLQKQIEKIYHKIALQIVRRGAISESTVAEEVAEPKEEKAKKLSDDQVQDTGDQTIDLKDKMESEELQDLDAAKNVKEKTIAARRSDIKTIIFPLVNRRDFDELAPNVKGLDVHFVDNYYQIFDLAFGDEQQVQEKLNP